MFILNTVVEVSCKVKMRLLGVRLTDGFDVPVIGAAAAADEGKRRQQSAQQPVFFAKLQRVAHIEIRALVELGMAAFRGVGPQAANALAPRGPLSGGDRLDHAALRRWIHVGDGLLRRDAVGRGRAS